MAGCWIYHSPKSSISFFFSRIEDLCLDFTLPGYADYILSFDEDHKIVNMGNLEVYVSHIVDATIHTGISRQVEAFKSGLTRYCSLVMELQLLEIIKEFEYEQRRLFLQFVTGAPRLPTRGSASLNPKLTIVRKVCDIDILPSIDYSHYSITYPLGALYSIAATVKMWTFPV
uniref:HECT domain-containing protein n=1 Tax=Populus alba TaxID=43335 RepID=A0A4V5ZZB9_POPAL|nr:hypothetical protein D5086_0000317040 [Populus alba]